MLGASCGMLFSVYHTGPAMLEIQHEKKTNVLSTSEQILKAVGVILFAF